MKIFFSEESRQDILEIASYIAEDNPKKALEYIDNLQAACLSLKAFPLSGKDRSDLEMGTRMLVYKKHLIFYHVVKDQVNIDRFLHSSRDVETLFEGKWSLKTP
jgi:toxin ParE1/3/4